jgi:phospholipase C
MWARRKKARQLELARERIQHVVVLLLENRSFDHLFGFLDHPKAGGEFHQLRPGKCPNPLDTTRRGSPKAGVNANGRHVLQRDPPHSHVAAKQQLNGRGGWKRFRMNGFVSAYGLKLAGREHLPYLHWVRIYLVVALISLAVVLAALDVLVLTDAWAAFLVIFLLAVLFLGFFAYRIDKLLKPRSPPVWQLVAGPVLLAYVFAAGLVGAIHRLSSGVGNLLWIWVPAVLLAEAAAQVVRVRTNRKLRASIAPEAVAQASRRIMRCMPQSEIPVMAKLAIEYAVCTRWHSSVPGATWPNRNFMHAATSDQSVDIEIGFYESKTIFEQLDEAQDDNAEGTPIPWRIYHDGLAQVTAFRRLWSGELQDRWFTIDKLKTHADTGTLARYSFIEPRHSGSGSNSQHPGNNMEVSEDGTTDFYRGEVLIKQVYDALKGVLNKTMLIITYDEHGGFFDRSRPRRVPRPKPIDSNSRNAIGLFRRLISTFVEHQNSPFDFRRLGIRVPAVVVSAWVDPGKVDPNPYDHTSVIATVRKLFAPRCAALTRRDRKARSLHSLVATRSQAREQLPDLPEPSPDTGGRAEPVPDEPEAGPVSTTSGRAKQMRVTAAPKQGATHASPTVASDLREQLEALAPKVENELEPQDIPGTEHAKRSATALPSSSAVGDLFARSAQRKRGNPR